MVERAMLRGDTKILKLTFRQSSGAPLNLGGAKIWFVAKTAYAYPDTSAVIRLTSDAAGGITVDDAAQGKATVTIPPLVTSTLPDASVSLVYAIRIQDAGGVVTTIESGVLRVEPTAVNAPSGG